jgi:EAL domain-containing protein (putative c-di-GMP-specific phosphodiesterase class I)
MHAYESANFDLPHVCCLTSKGCNEVQGFLFSPARPAEVERLLDGLAIRAEKVA